MFPSCATAVPLGAKVLGFSLEPRAFAQWSRGIRMLVGIDIEQPRLCRQILCGVCESQAPPSEVITILLAVIHNTHNPHIEISKKITSDPRAHLR